MFDRVPENPGRVKITPENGGAAYYVKMERADNPVQEGTPLNKETLLTDEAAALFGLSSDAVPNDVFDVLKDVALYKRVPTRTKKTLGEFAEGDKIYLNESGTMTAYVVAKHNYQADLNGNGRTLLIRNKSWTTARTYWDKADISTYNGSKPDTYLQTEFIAKFESDVQEAIGTTKIYYTVGSASTAGNIDKTISVLERNIFLPSVAELGLTDRCSCNAEGERIDVLADNLTNFMSSSTTKHWTRTPSTSTTGVCAFYFNTSNNYMYCDNGLLGSANSCRELPMFTMPEDFVFYVDVHGNFYKEQDYEITVTRADGSEFEKPVGTQIAYGTYKGTGTYNNKANGNVLAFDFEPKYVLIPGSGTDWFAGINCGSVAKRISGEDSTSCFGDLVTFVFEGTTVTWYSARSAESQGNASGSTYGYWAIG